MESMLMLRAIAAAKKKNDRIDANKPIPGFFFPILKHSVAEGAPFFDCH